ncbi:maleylacetoacetate isomerase-like [Convolutriloba macropyga]|uniref:maleylacetoacetate isomerase-like n=1 Tax=Convolutriloba macropyga TaxID=536237 RepID=UPI003F51F60A
MDSDMPKVILYSYFRSSCAWRVRSLLTFKGIEFEYRPINLLKLEHKEPEFLKINPGGQLPALVFNGHAMAESGTIMEFLEEMYPDRNPAMPTDPYQRQIVRRLCAHIGGLIQPLQNAFVSMKIADKYADGDEEKKAFIKKDWPKSVVTDGFMALEKMLVEHSGKYCVGDSITMADFFLVPQVGNAHRFGVDMSLFPTIVRLNETLLQVECIKSNHPMLQPDAPPQ